MPKDTRTRIGSAEFKARCLELVEHVREARAEYVVTRHGVPVARLVPLETASENAALIGSMTGSVLQYDDPFAPIPGEWITDADPLSHR